MQEAAQSNAQQDAAVQDKDVLIGLFSREEVRLAGLTCLFEEELAHGGRRLTPAPGPLHDLLANRQLRYLLIDLNDWTDKRRILETIHRARPDLRLIVIGPQEDELVVEALHAGARAYLDLTTSLEIVRNALTVVVGGSIWAPRPLIARMLERLADAAQPALGDANPRLTEREAQVLELILNAHSNREIAQQLGIEERTVKAHVGRLMKKTGAGNRVDLSVRALDQSLSVQLEAAMLGGE